MSLPAGRYETLLPPSAVADLLLMLAWSMGGRRGAGGPQRASPGRAGTRVGERLTDAPLTLASDPAAPGLEYAPFVAAPALGRRRSACSTTARPRGASSGCATARSASWPTAGPRPREFGTAFAPPGDNLLLTGGSAASLAEMVAGTAARPAADLPVVHPRGRPGDAAADRPDPRRRLPGGERRGGRLRSTTTSGSTTPRWTSCGRRRRWAPPSARCRASGRTGSPGWRCRRCGCRS